MTKCPRIKTFKISYEKNGYKKYPYKESDSYERLFQITTNPRKVRLDFLDDPTEMDMVVSKQFHDAREYQFNRNPAEMHEIGEEYLEFQADLLVKDEYTFNFRLSEVDEEWKANKGANNSIVWLHIGFMPKSETQFLNERAYIEKFNSSMYWESLGTHEVTFKGPGEGLNKMFGRPTLFETRTNPEQFYGPYYWGYGLTDSAGEVSFDVSFDQDYIQDFFNIFGTLESFNSIDDVVLYMRAFSTPFGYSDLNWSNFALHNSENYVCSQNGTIFKGENIIEEYDFTELKLQDFTYAEGIIRLHRKDIVMGVLDYPVYNLPDGSEPLKQQYEDMVLPVYLTEAEVIPEGVSPDYKFLNEVHELNQLEPTGETLLTKYQDHYAYINVISPAGNLKGQYFKKINVTSEGQGTISISNTTMVELLDKLGLGLSTIQIQVEGSLFYKPSVQRSRKMYQKAKEFR